MLGTLQALSERLALRTTNHSFCAVAGHSDILWPATGLALLHRRTVYTANGAWSLVADHPQPINSSRTVTNAMMIAVSVGSTSPE